MSRWGNPAIPWTEFERKLSGRRRPGGPPGEADGGDSPAWTWHRPPYDPPESDLPRRPEQPHVPYAELHCHSNFSFLDGASHPEELVEEAVRLGLRALALTDHDGFYGVARMAEAAEKCELDTIFGAELSLDLSAPQNGVADPEGRHLVVLARGPEGYHRLAGAITEAQLRGAEKGRPVYDLDALADRADGHWLVLTGCRKGAVPWALANAGPDAAERELDRLVELFGPANVAVELFDHGYPLDTDRNDALYAMGLSRRLPIVATNNVHFASPERRNLATAIAAVRARRSLDEIDGWLPAAGTAHLRSGPEMAQRFARYPGAVARTVELADELVFSLQKAKPKLPGHTWRDRDPMERLRELVHEGARKLYEGRYSGKQLKDRYERLEAELKVIQDLGFPGYFLIVHDIVEFANKKGILCQGRGSAANSLVCNALGITAVDAHYYQLPFARFLATTRQEEPDIDVDFESDRREEVIQYVYTKYGRARAAQVANVISYRPKLAVRDMAKALGYSAGKQDAWSKQMDSWGSAATPSTAPTHPPAEATDDVPTSVKQLAEQLLTFPRHLGIHSGGMVLTDRPVGEVCPIEYARKENRTVLQWDKDDCAFMGLVKFDLLGLGMLSALRYTIDGLEQYFGETYALESIPRGEVAVYDMLCRADSVGVFQVESRAQMATLPRLRPRKFYELAIEIALIRPGPIQGGAVHPYIRRKLGDDSADPPHKSLQEALDRTLGVPLFQEQLMQIATKLGDLTDDEADLLRRAMGSKRGVAKISSLKRKLYDGMAGLGIEGEAADLIYEKIEAFANFGFAESHAISFALLVYASAWFKLHYPAVFLAALLRAQPMGFYSAQSLVADARRHGVEVRRPDLRESDVHANVEPLDPENRSTAVTGDPACLRDFDGEPPAFDPAAPVDDARHRRDGNVAVRLGLSGVKSIGEKVAQKIVDERERGGWYTDLHDLARRAELTATQLEALATAGVFEGLGLTRRQALWLAGSAAQERPDQLSSSGPTDRPDLQRQIPLLPSMRPAERVMADLWATGISPDDHPTRHVRDWLDSLGVVPANRLVEVEHGVRVVVGGVVTHRQKPSTAQGVTFLNLEDETGMINIICSVGTWRRYRREARESPALLIRGQVQRAEGVTNIMADKISPLPLTVKSMSRDFR